MRIKHNNQIFPVIIEGEEGGGYIVINPAFEGCYSQGDTIEEALQNIKEATQLCIEDAKDRLQKIKRKNISLHMINLKDNYA